MQQLEAGALQLVARRRDSFRALHLELDGCLGNDPVGWPLGRAKARLRRLREGPDTEVFRAGDAPAGVVALALALQLEAEGVHEELPALRWVGHDDCHARNELNVQVAQPTPRSAPDLPQNAARRRSGSRSPEA